MHTFSIELSKPPGVYIQHVSELHRHGFKLKGDERAGEITGMGVTARYTISGQTALVELRKNKLNPIPYGMIEAEIRKLFSQV